MVSLRERGAKIMYAIHKVRVVMANHGSIAGRYVKRMKPVMMASVPVRSVPRMLWLCWGFWFIRFRLLV